MKEKNDRKKLVKISSLSTQLLKNVKMVSMN